MRPLVLAAFATALAAPAADQQFHVLRGLDAGGGRVAECRLGFRTYGELNAAKSNAVLFPTWFNGTTAGLEPMIGPGRPFDPAGLFIITVDALGNGVSCSPSNSSAAFPKITIAGMVESQRRLLAERFGITRLHAVTGISMGGMQTFEWIVRHPEMAARAIPIIGSPRLNASDLLLWNAQLRAIRALEQAGANPAQAMPAVQAMHQFALQTPDRRAVLNAEETATLLAQTQAPGPQDPRDWAAQLEAMIAHDVAQGGDLKQAAARVRAQTLVIVATHDHMVHPAPARDFARLANLKLIELTSDCGHLAISCEEPLLAQAVRQFLAP